MKAWSDSEDGLKTNPKMAICLSKMIAYFTEATGQRFEQLTINWELTMRHVRQQAISLKVDDIDWTSAPLTLLYPTPHTNLDQELEAMKFDFTKPLDNILVFESVEELVNKYTPAQLTSNAFVPKNPNNPGYDWLLFF